MMRWLRRMGAAHPRWVLALAAVLLVLGSLRFFLGTRHKDGTPEIRIGLPKRFVRTSR